MKADQVIRKWLSQAYKISGVHIFGYLAVLVHTERLSDQICGRSNIQPSRDHEVRGCVCALRYCRSVNVAGHNLRRIFCLEFSIMCLI